jgi:hypothetical protein
MTDTDELQQQIQGIKELVDANTASIKSNAVAISSNSRGLKRERLERELEGCKGKFRISGYVWTLAGFGRPGNAARRKFIKNLTRIVFVNTELMTEEEAAKLLIIDCKPIVWKDEKPLEVTFDDRVLWHAVKEKLSVKGPNHPSIKIRIMLPKILNAMYDDCLRYRRVLLDEDPDQTLFIDSKPSEPYIFLVKKTEGGRTRVEVKWLDERLKDPVENHETFTYPPGSDRDQTKVKHGGRGGGARGGGARGGRGGRGGGTVTPSAGGPKLRSKGAAEFDGIDDGQAAAGGQRSGNEAMECA